MTLKGASLDNSRSGVISAKGAVDIRTGVLDNSRGGIGMAPASPWWPPGWTTASGAGSASLLDANLKGLDQRGGVLVSETGVTLDLNGGGTLVQPATAA